MSKPMAPADALAALVKALDSTYWSSWQTTANFDNQLAEARRTLRREQMAEAAPYLLAALRRLIDAHPVPSTVCKERPAYDQAIAAIKIATWDES